MKICRNNTMQDVKSALPQTDGIVFAVDSLELDPTQTRGNTKTASTPTSLRGVEHDGHDKTLLINHQIKSLQANQQIAANITRKSHHGVSVSANGSPVQHHE